MMVVVNDAAMLCSVLGSGPPSPDGGRSYVPKIMVKNALPRWGKDLHVVGSSMPSERAALPR